MIIQGSAITPHATKYVLQLCSHWGHRFEVETTDGASRIDFGDGSSAALSTDGDRLLLTLDASADGIRGLKAIVEEHVDRFAHREGGLHYTWD